MVHITNAYAYYSIIVERNAKYPSFWSQDFVVTEGGLHSGPDIRQICGENTAESALPAEGG